MIVASIAIKYTQSNSVGYAIDGQMIGQLRSIVQLHLLNVLKQNTNTNTNEYKHNHDTRTGVGAGQQSRVDCVKLAGSKAETWYLRQHPKVRNLSFKAGLKRVDRVNARIRYIEGDFTSVEERKAWEDQLTSVPEELTAEEKKEFLKTLKGVSLASDAFFPFRDNIDQALRRGVSVVWCGVVWCGGDRISSTNDLCVE